MAYTLHDVEKKKKEYDEALANKPNAFYSGYQSLRDGVLSEIASRKDFSYDPLSDEVYNLYKDRYAHEGQKAMKDAVASASALTGGYSNSYAARAGAEAYGDYIKKSSDIIPELYDLALQRYKLKSSYEDDLYSYYSDLYEVDLDEYEGLWDRYYKEISERESAYKTAKDSYDYDERLKAEAEELRKKAEAEAEEVRKKAEAEALKKTEANKTSSSSNKTSSSSNKTSTSTAVKRETEAIKSFRSSLFSKAQFNRSPLGRTYPSYNDYVRMTAQSWYKDGRITEGELNYIKDMYVLR